MTIPDMPQARTPEQRAESESDASLLHRAADSLERAALDSAIGIVPLAPRETTALVAVLRSGVQAATDGPGADGLLVVLARAILREES